MRRTTRKSRGARNNYRAPAVKDATKDGSPISSNRQVERAVQGSIAQSEVERVHLRIEAASRALERGASLPMQWKAVSRYFRSCTVAWLAVSGLVAAEHHGVVKFGNVPMMGATVTASSHDGKKVAAVTDETGAYSFPDLADGVWQMHVEMLCFAPITKDIGVAPVAPAAEWELTLLSMDELKAGAQPRRFLGAVPRNFGSTLLLRLRLALLVLVLVLRHISVTLSHGFRIWLCAPGVRAVFPGS